MGGFGFISTKISGEFFYYKRQQKCVFLWGTRFYKSLLCTFLSLILRCHYYAYSIR